MLVSLVIELAPSRNRPTGTGVQGWLLREIVAARDPQLATALHDAKGRKPYAIGIATADDAATATEGVSSVRLRISSTDPALSRLLYGLRPRDLGRLELGLHKFTVRRLHVRSTQHPMAATTTLLRLWRDGSRRDLPGRVRLRFLSPTAFDGDLTRADGTKERRNTLPGGALVFRPLIEAWNAAIDADEANGDTPPVSETVRAELLQLLREEEYSLETVPPVHFGRFAEKGFMGECEYSVGRRASPDARRALHALALFAFFTGIGMRTQMGMGQAICGRG